MPGLDRNYTFHIDNDEPLNISLTVIGDLQDHITLSEKNFILEGVKYITFQVRLPREVAPGDYNSHIEISSSPTTEEMINVVSRLSHKIRMQVPTHGKYIREEISVLSENIEINIKNIGLKTIRNIEVDGIIHGKGYNQTYEKTSKNFIPNSSFRLDMPRTMNQGIYQLDLDIRYDNLSKSLSKKLVIGDINIDVLNPRFEGFKAGEINSIEIPLRTDWNQEIRDLHLVLEVEKDNQTIMEARSPDFSLDKNITVEMFWDTEGFEEGAYRFSIRVYHEQEILSEEAFLIEMKDDGPAEEKSFDTVLIIIAIIMVILSMIFYSRNKKISDENK